jgi:hypothetical protein
MSPFGDMVRLRGLRKSWRFDKELEIQVCLSVELMRPEPQV